MTQLPPVFQGSEYSEIPTMKKHTTVKETAMARGTCDHQGATKQDRRPQQISVQDAFSAACLHVRISTLTKSVGFPEIVVFSLIGFHLSINKITDYMVSSG